jgi:hypothetical protein
MPPLSHHIPGMISFQVSKNFQLRLHRHTLLPLGQVQNNLIYSIVHIKLGYISVLVQISWRWQLVACVRTVSWSSRTILIPSPLSCFVLEPLQRSGKLFFFYIVVPVVRDGHFRYFIDLPIFDTYRIQKKVSKVVSCERLIRGGGGLCTYILAFFLMKMTFFEFL